MVRLLSVPHEVGRVDGGLDVEALLRLAAWLGVERGSDFADWLRCSDWVPRFLLKTPPVKTLLKAPVNRHEVRARCGAINVAEASLGAMPRATYSARIRTFNSSRISAIVAKRSFGFFASARSSSA